MPLDLPIYLIVGDRPVSLVETPDGGMSLMGWDFERRGMTREAASWDNVVDLQVPSWSRSGSRRARRSASTEGPSTARYVLRGG